MESETYMLGYTACAVGKSEKNNPFVITDPRRDLWFEGWHDARADYLNSGEYTLLQGV